MKSITTLDFWQKIAETVNAIDYDPEIHSGQDNNIRFTATTALVESLQTCTRQIIAVTDNISFQFNLLTREQVQRILSYSLTLFQSAERLFSSKDKSLLGEEIFKAIADFKIELKELREILNDLSRFKAESYTDWGELIKD